MRLRIDDFWALLQNYRNSTGYIVFTSREKSPEQAALKLRFAIDHLINHRKFDANRIKVVDGGRENELQFR